jgi:hypothetical protein
MDISMPKERHEPQRRDRAIYTTPVTTAEDSGSDDLTFDAVGEIWSGR